MSEELWIPKNYFSTHIRILRVLGLWSGENSGFRGSRNEILYFIYQITFLFTFGYLFTVLEIIQLFFSWKKFDDFITNLCYAIVHVMACSKISLILIRAKEIQRLTKSFESGIFQIRGTRTPEELELVKNCIIRTKRLLNIYFLIGTSVVINGLLCPLYISADSNNNRKYHFENYTTMVRVDREIETRPKLPYMSYFPFDVDVTPYHELAYAYQAFSLMILSPIIITTDVFYGSILLHIATQLRILARTLICLKSVAVKKLQRFNSENHPKLIPTNLLTDEIYGSLKHCVLHHHAIISLTVEMERIFSILVLLQFLCNLVIMCFPLFQITSVPIMSFPFFSMVSLMTAMMYQLFIFCNCGDEVTQQSMLVADAAYFSDWYDSCTPTINRAILMIINRSRRPLKLTAAKFAILSRETYMKVVQGSASYFMFLRRMRDDP